MQFISFDVCFSCSESQLYKQVDELNVCWNSVIRRIFGYQRSESVKDVIYGHGRLNVKHLLLLRRVKFYYHLYLCPVAN